MQEVQSGTVLPISEGRIQIKSQISHGLERLSSEDLRHRLRRGCYGRSPQPSRSPRLSSDSLLVHSSESPTHRISYLIQTSFVPIVFHPDFFQDGPLLVDVKG